MLCAILSIIFSVFSRPATASPKASYASTCDGARKDDSFEDLKDRIGFLNGSPIEITSCASGARCDGGFKWLPLMINRERGWILYTFPGIFTWVSVSLSDVCKRHDLVRGSFQNQVASKNIERSAVNVPSKVMSESVPNYRAFDNLWLRLSVEKNRYVVTVVGAAPILGIPVVIDSFEVEPL